MGCTFVVHSDTSVSEWFCCGLCVSAYFAEPREKPEHGKRCEGVVASEGLQRAKPPSKKPDSSYNKWNGADSWKDSKDSSDRKERKGSGKSSRKGKGKGKRDKNVDVEAV